ncbi:MAG TPA: dihydrolipoyl dehydrogenase [Halanaerobiales bacterium]|nr:dihydrolipoyl dehydrogenase [Halanaerobiales bacterium]
MTEKKITIIGAGTGGYVAAIKAAQLGADVTLIEKENIGGTCLNWGCIPTKALVYSAEKYSEMQEARRFGIEVNDVNLNMKRVIRNKDTIVKQLVGGVEFLLDKHNVKVYKGVASLLDQNTVSVKTEDGREIIETDYIILATGSKVKKAPIKGIDMEGILTSRDILDLEELPESLAVIGGGVIGMEFAFIYANFGVDIKVVEYLDDILPGVDQEVTSELGKVAKRAKIDITTGAQVKEVAKTDSGYQVKYLKDEENQTIEVDKVLVATGREPSFGGLDLDKIGVEKENNAIKVDEHLKTSVDNIYAVGDVTGKILLAHVASHQGVVAVENIMGEEKKMDYDAVPAAIFTKPEIATVGLTEEEVKEAGIDYNIGKFPFRANGKVKTMNKRNGFIKIISKKDSGEILGSSIIGVHATDLIHELTLAVNKNMTIEDIIETIHAHPTTSEVIHEAALDSIGGALHYVRLNR